MTYTPSPPHTRRSGARGATILILCMIAVIALFAVSAGMSESEHTQDTTIPTTPIHTSHQECMRHAMVQYATHMNDGTLDAQILQCDREFDVVFEPQGTPVEWQACIERELDRFTDVGARDSHELNFFDRAVMRVAISYCNTGYPDGVPTP